MRLRLHYCQDDGHRFTVDTTIYTESGGPRRLNRLIRGGHHKPYYSWQPTTHVVRIEVL